MMYYLNRALSGVLHEPVVECIPVNCEPGSCLTVHTKYYVGEARPFPALRTAFCRGWSLAEHGRAALVTGPCSMNSNSCAACTCTL